MKKSITLLALASAIMLGSIQPTHAAGGWLGVHPEQPRGVQVGDIIKDSPADKSGLLRGDIILRLNDHELFNVSQFSMEIYRLNPGSEVTLSVQRNGEIKEIKAKLDNGAGHVQAFPGLGTPRMPEVQSPFSFNRAPLQSRPPGSGSIGQGHTHDYQTRMKSAWSMLEAYDRIAEEKKLGEPGKQTSSEIRAMLNQSQQFLNKFQINEGVSLLDRAYNKVQDALIQLRKGETLYQTLNFATPEAEYIYELGRNNVFQMLLEQGLNSQGIGNESSTQIAEARDLRGKAEENALKKEFKNGIEQLEHSTTLLIELLRKAGLDIP
ncbi:MAG: PDZ domain-containing protein [Magnetococcus sp. YQC-5]